MKHFSLCAALLLSFSAALSSACAIAQIPHTRSGGASPAVNGSVALNNGGNPAGAIGAATLNQSAPPNNAPLIVGNAGTVGVNGTTGSNAAASSVNGVDRVSTVYNSESIGMRRARLHAQENVNSDAVGLTLSAVPLMGTLETTSMGSRDELGAQLDQNIEAGQRAMSAAEAHAKNLDPDARAEFEAAARQVRAAERRLQNSLKAVQTASAAEWTQARDALAADYDRYAQAVAQAQRIALTGAMAETATFDRR